MFPCACENWEAGDGTEHHRAIAVVFESDERAQEGGLDGAIFASELFDFCGRESCDFGSVGGSPLGDALGKFAVADCMVADVFMIDEGIADEHVHDGECEHGIGARTNLQMPVAGFSSAGADGIDADDLCTTTTGFKDNWPEVQIGDDGIGAPEHDEAAVNEVFRIHANSTSLRGSESGMRHCSADISLEPAGSKESEEPLVERRVLDESLIPGGAEGENGLSAEFGDDRFPACGDFCESIIPGNAFEGALPFWSGTSQRIEDSFLVIDSVEVMIDFGAQSTACEWVAGISAEGSGLAVDNFNEPCAGIGAVVAAGSADDSEWGVHFDGSEVDSTELPEDGEGADCEAPAGKPVQAVCCELLNEPAEAERANNKAG